MAASVTTMLWSLTDLVRVIEDREGLGAQKLVGSSDRVQEGIAMRKSGVCMSMLACAIAMSPAAAYPQDGSQLHMAAALSDLHRDAAVGINEVLMIGVGIVIGGVAGYSLLPLERGMLIGALAGGVIGDWWYRRQMDTEYQPPPTPLH